MSRSRRCDRCGAVQAVDKNTLLQLKGAAARGFAFDRHYSMDDTSDTLYRDLIEGLVDNIFKVGVCVCALSAVCIRCGRSSVHARDPQCLGSSALSSSDDRSRVGDGVSL